MKRIIIFSIIISLVAGFMISFAGGSSSICIESTTGRILYQQNCDMKLPMASTTKIMTALIALEKGDLDEIVKVDDKAVGIEGSSIYLGYGEELSLRDLIYGLMLRSGNDAATAIAIHIGGTEEKFVEMMNEKAESMGLKKTHFTNPHGLDNEMHYTTAYELALIMREAMKNETFREISSTKSYNSSRVNNSVFYNKNKVLFDYVGGNGGKTGYTKRTGRCLVSTAKREDMQLITVVLNTYDWFNTSYRIMDSVFEKYDMVKVIDKGHEVYSMKIEDSSTTELSLAPDTSMYVPVKAEEKPKVTTTFTTTDKVIAPVIKGEVLGNVKVYLDGEIMSTHNLVAMNDVEEYTVKERIKNLFEK